MSRDKTSTVRIRRAFIGVGKRRRHSVKVRAIGYQTETALLDDVITDLQRTRAAVSGGSDHTPGSTKGSEQ